MDLKLQGQNAIVAGASKGLGLAVAKVLAAEGANVMLAARSEDKLKVAVDEINQAGQGKATYQVTDLRNLHAIENLVEVSRQKFGPINILFNNAGGPPSGPFLDFLDEDWNQAYELNLLSYIRLIRLVLPDMKEHGGRVLNNASITVKEPVADMGLSNVFRAGVHALTKTLVQDYQGYDIMFNTIAPGTVYTDRIDQLNQARADRQGLTRDEIETQQAATIPLGRMGKPEEFGTVAAFYLSPLNTYTTGQFISVDGGKLKAF